jgi:hypothetical protein
VVEVMRGSHCQYVFQVGRPQIEPAARAMPVNTVAISAAAPASTHQPSLRRHSHIPPKDRVIFLEVHKSDSSDFEEDLVVRVVDKHGYRVLEVRSGNIPNTIASVLLKIRDETDVVPTIYFEWSEGSPLSNLFKYLITGVGDVAPVTREVLRESEPNMKRRPSVHVS